MSGALACYTLVFLYLISASSADVSGKRDRCKKTDALFPSGNHDYAISTTNCDGKAPFVDPRDIEEGAQCRVLCERYSNSTFSINPRDSQCEVCRSSAVLSFFGPEENFERDICVPLEVCESTCGKPPPGCLYTGSCSRWWCAVSNDKNAIPAALVEVNVPGEEGNVYGVLPGTTVNQVSLNNSSGSIISGGGDNSSTAGTTEGGDGDAIGNTVGDDSSEEKSLSRSAIIGISATAVGIVVTALVTIIVTYINRKKKRNASAV